MIIKYPPVSPLQCLCCLFLQMNTSAFLKSERNEITVARSNISLQIWRIHFSFSKEEKSGSMKHVLNSSCCQPVAAWREVGPGSNRSWLVWLVCLLMQSLLVGRGVVIMEFIDPEWTVHCSERWRCFCSSLKNSFYRVFAFACLQYMVCQQQHWSNILYSFYRGWDWKLFYSNFRLF